MRTGLATIALILGMGVLGCHKEESATPEAQPTPTNSSNHASALDSLKEHYTKAVDSAQQMLEAGKAEIITHTQTQLEQLSQAIQDLAKKTQNLQSDAKTNADHIIADLQAKRKVVADKLSDFKKSGTNIVEQVKSGLIAALDDLTNAVATARKKLDQ